MIFILGSARDARAGDRGLAISKFLLRIDLICFSEDFGGAAEIGTRVAYAPQNQQSLRVSLLNLSRQMMLPVAANGN
jgi:hypothetical protein